MTYDGPERRDQDDADKRLARLIVDEAMKRIYMEMGKGVFRKIVWLGLAVFVALGFKFGIIKLPV